MPFTHKSCRQLGLAAGTPVGGAHQCCWPALGHSGSARSAAVSTATWKLWWGAKAEVRTPASQGGTLVQEHCIKEVRLLSISLCGADVPFVTLEHGKLSPGCPLLLLCLSAATGPTDFITTKTKQIRRDEDT